jgi:hypothetical protein
MRWITGMTLDPLPVDLMPLHGGIQTFPQVLILHWLLIGGAPAARLPRRQPFVESLHHVFGVSVERDCTRLLEGLQCDDRRHQLHAIVGGQRFAAA